MIVFMKNCRMDQRRYNSRNWIPMFFGTPCTIDFCKELNNFLIEYSENQKTME